MSEEATIERFDLLERQKEFDCGTWMRRHTSGSIRNKTIRNW